MNTERFFQIGDVSDNGQVTIVDEDRLCYLVRSESRGSVGLRTISKTLLKEYIAYFTEHPNANANIARDFLCGRSEVDKFEYGYTSTLTVMAKMAIEGAKNRSIEAGRKWKTDKPLQQIYYGAPGTGKSHTIKKKENEGLYCIRTTFHPDSDYATFVGCYKPHRNRQTGELTYEFVEQAFLEAYIWAWTNPEKECALVIEEINRGNCAQIFGDIFQLLDRDDDGWSTYPIKADTDICDHLEDLAIIGYSEMMARRYGEDKSGYCYMALPPNMSILATMNTSDQSLFPIDSAFKRRWEWEYIPIARGKDKDGKELGWKIETTATNKSWWDFLRSINVVIEATTHSEDKELGFFFCKADEAGKISKERFVNKVVFYLWNDVFKTYGFRSDIFDKDADGTEKLSFRDFYKKDGSVDENTLALFLNNVMKHLTKDEKAMADETE